MDSVVDKYKQQSRLSFTYSFEYEHDTVFFSHYVPYTYTDLISFLSQLAIPPSEITSTPEVATSVRIEPATETDGIPNVEEVPDEGPDSKDKSPSTTAEDSSDKHPIEQAPLDKTAPEIENNVELQRKWV